MKSTIDPLELQRLLDGRLSRSERAAFLDSLDDDPQHWRTVALAYVEEQVLRETLSPAAGAAASAPQKSALPRSRGRASWLLTSLALMMFSLTVGVLVGRSDLLADSSGDRALPDPAATPVAQTPSQAGDGDYYVVVTPPPVSRGDDDVRKRRGDAFDALTTPVFDQRSREIARQHGYQLSEEPVLYLIDDGQGGQYLIPQRMVSFVPERKQ